jgi:hypothetical protein
MTPSMERSNLAESPNATHEEVLIEFLLASPMLKFTCLDVLPFVIS